ncbi:MAG: MFS transporter, partial [Patescibacteria group bacterium]
SLKIHKHTRVTALVEQEKISVRQTLGVWWTLLKRVYPLYIFLFILSFVDATFWSVGTVFSETLKDTSMLGRFIIPVYMLPSLGLSVFAGPAAKPFGKKRIAFLCGIVMGLGLLTVGFVHNVHLILIAIFFSSVFSAIALPEVAASFEDYVERLGSAGSNMIGLQGSAVSLAYIIGPIVAGTLSGIVGNQKTFAVVGGIVLIVSIIVLIITPRKLKMPQAEIQEGTR